MSITKDDFIYDVFISYRQKEPDKNWVQNVLLPRLEKEGIRTFIDFRDFRLGASLVHEMARAVEQSRYTVAVFTPNYLTSNYTELENILAEHLGLEKGHRRLLVIMREKCEPRLGVRAKRWLDMTNDNEFEKNIVWLINQLQESS